MDWEVEDGGYTHPTPWDSEKWRAAAIDWIESQVKPGGPLGVRLRPWSIVIRVPVAGQAPVWFKANPPGSAWEPALMRALAGWVPGSVLTPIAVDVARAWSLNPDGGEYVPPSSWPSTITAYAAFQRATFAHVNELLAMGLPDVRPAALPARLDELLDVSPNPDVAAARGRIVDWCAELEAGGVPAALDHSDLHEHQVFEGPRFFDWGDASVGHPFSSLLVTVRVIRHRYGADAEALVARVRDAYLEGFDVDLPTGRRLARLACRLGPIGRAATWGRVFPSTGGDPDTTGQVAAWLARLLEEPPL